MNNYEEQRAYRLAVDLIKKQMQKIAFDRSMFHKVGARYPQAVQAAEEYDKLQAALNMFEEKLPTPRKKAAPASVKKANSWHPCGHPSGTPSGAPGVCTEAV
jgi:hypothetical protein